MSTQRQVIPFPQKRSQFWFTKLKWIPSLFVHKVRTKCGITAVRIYNRHNGLAKNCDLCRQLRREPSHHRLHTKNNLSSFGKVTAFSIIIFVLWIIY